MKKTALVFGILILGSVLFAENAKVLPTRVGMAFITPDYTFATGLNDNEGRYEKFKNESAVFFNMGFGFEYGILGWITATAQWAPGWTLWTDIDSAKNDRSNLVIGAKIQVIGEDAPVRSEAFRAAVAPGVHIPLMGDHTFALGAGFYFDAIFNKNFFVNIYNETLFYPSKQDLSKVEPEYHGAKGEAGHSLTFEMEPVFTTPIGATGIDFTAGLPFAYRYLSAPMHSLGIGPNILFSFPELPLPLEFKFRYDIPLWGRNSAAMHSVALQIRAYYNFGR